MIVTIDVIELGEKYLQRIIVPTESKISGHLLRGTESFSKIVTWLALERLTFTHSFTREVNSQIYAFVITVRLSRLNGRKGRDIVLEISMKMIK